MFIRKMTNFLRISRHTFTMHALINFRSPIYSLDKLELTQNLLLSQSKLLKTGQFFEEYIIAYELSPQKAHN
jgi:hypothetical protein